MATIPVLIKIEQADVSNRSHGTMMREALRAASEHHVAFHLPRRFEDSPATRHGGDLGFARRTSKWLKRKRAIVGHEIPNVFTGQMRNAVLGSAASGITATQYRSRIRVRNYFAMRPERWAEIRNMTPGELRTLTQVAARKYRELLPQFISKRRVQG